jgi:transposase-like protein
LREGSFFPSLLEPRRRIDRAPLAVVMEADVHGTSTRKVDDLVKALGVEAGISKSELSRICGELDAEVAAFGSRPRSHPPSLVVSDAHTGVKQAIAAVLAEAREDLTAFRHDPVAHWRKLWSTTRWSG